MYPFRTDGTHLQLPLVERETPRRAVTPRTSETVITAVKVDTHESK